MKAETTCRECGSRVEQKQGRGRAATYCSDACRRLGRNRYSRQGYQKKKRGFEKRGTCAGCGVPIWKASSSRPQGEARCRPCRRIELADIPPKPKSDKRTPCTICGIPSWGVRCWPCRVADDQAQAKGRNLEARRELERRRAARVRQAPGLTPSQYHNLRAKWMRQKRTCTYCPAVATTVDHVIPIALGGTNCEGNLVPCCRSCNVRKNDSLLIEWKHKRRTKRERVTVTLTTPKPVKGKTSKVHFPTCDRCDVLFTAKTKAKRFCSDRCMRGLPEVHNCADCGVVVERSRHKCDTCVRETKRIRKREYKRRLRARRATERQQLAA